MSSRCHASENEISGLVHNLDQIHFTEDRLFLDQNLSTLGASTRALLGASSTGTETGSTSLTLPPLAFREFPMIV